MMLTAGTIGSYTLNYMTTYALDTLHLPATISFTPHHHQRRRVDDASRR